TRSDRDWSSDVCSSDLEVAVVQVEVVVLGACVADEQVLEAVVVHVGPCARDRELRAGSERRRVDPRERVSRWATARVEEVGALRSEEHTSELQSRSDLV